MAGGAGTVSPCAAVTAAHRSRRLERRRTRLSSGSGARRVGAAPRQDGAASCRSRAAAATSDLVATLHPCRVASPPGPAPTAPGSRLPSRQAAMAYLPVAIKPSQAVLPSQYRSARAGRLGGRRVPGALSARRRRLASSASRAPSSHVRICVMSIAHIGRAGDGREGERGLVDPRDRHRPCPAPPRPCVIGIAIMRFTEARASVCCDNCCPACGAGCC